MKLDHHIFVCTNHKGKHGCSEAKGLELIAKFKRLLHKKGFKKEVRVQRSGCLHMCSHGPALCIYPKGTFYGNIKPKDVKLLVKKHIKKGKKVKKLAV